MEVNHEKEFCENSYRGGADSNRSGKYDYDCHGTSLSFIGQSAAEYIVPSKQSLL